ncbi:hypothetical protein IKF73_02555 [Candidatus Saccharibacteria bacterium]|nr:hypothetical protein [Candidatus Saccharibacteria bacterium]
MERNPWGGVVLLILVVVIVVIYRWHHKHNVVGAVVVEKSEYTNNYEPYNTKPLLIKGRLHLRRCYHSGEPLPIRIEFVWVKPIPMLGRRSERQEQTFLGSLKDCLNRIFASLDTISSDATERLDKEDILLNSLSSIINGKDKKVWPELAVRIKIIKPLKHEASTVLTSIAWENLFNPPCR